MLTPHYSSKHVESYLAISSEIHRLESMPHLPSPELLSHPFTHQLVVLEVKISSVFLIINLKHLHKVFLFIQATIRTV